VTSSVSARIAMLAFVIILSGLSPVAGLSLPQDHTLNPQQQLARDIFKELIEIDTTHSTGDTTKAAQAMAARLKAAGFADGDVQVIGPNERNRNLVVRLRGSGARPPVLFLAHFDVVEARREDWSMDPFKFNEIDGFFYGRGTYDVKCGAAILVASMIELKRDGFVPDRDVIVALTAGEESGGDYNGVQWLLTNRRDLIDAALCINMDAGDPLIKNGRRWVRTVQASEKVSITFRLEVKNAGGHSSRPTKENAIYDLAEGLSRLAAFEFPVRLDAITRNYFDRLSGLEKEPSAAADMKAVTSNPPDVAAVARLSASPYYNALLRTTCVATMIEGGHATNALPQTARATVNCRMLPSDSPSDVEETLKRLIGKKILLTRLTEPTLSKPSFPTADVMNAIERTTKELWPGVPIMLVMDTGASDGIYLRNVGVPTYGVSGVFIDVDDKRSHGKDERIAVKDYYDGAVYIHHFIKILSSKN
jgi:acetylornithine deacetylase/succinyl-diaminopimelate desuccinylase-like protein